MLDLIREYLRRPWSSALLLMLVSVTPALAVQPDVVIDGTQEKLALGHYLSVREDARHDLSIEEVARPEDAQRFIRSTAAIPNYGFSRSVYWARFTYAKMAKAQGRNWLLVVKQTTLEHVDVYFERPDGSFDIRRAGTLVPPSMRESALRYPLFKLPDTGPESVTVYIRFQSDFAISMPVEILTDEQLNHDTAAEWIALWIYVGTLVSMVLFNSILLFLLRDRTYLYYILYIVFFGLFVGLATGLGFEYFPNGASWLDWFFPACAHLGCIFIALFCRSFLNTQKTAPLLDRVLLGMAATSGAAALLATVIPARFSQIIASKLSMAYVPLLLIIATIVWRRGFRPALFFLVGWSMLSLGGLFYTLSGTGLLPRNLFTRHLMQVGSSLEMILFAIALASRINEAKRESEAAKRKVLEGELHRMRNIELKQANEEILRQQAQLIHAEKLASLGQLAAGVAHEIRNPLNFINNFSLSLVEMADELSQEIERLPVDRQGGLKSLIEEYRLTAQKVVEHGGRADAIVRGMIEHASTRPGERRMTDLHHLIEEYIGLVAHSTQARWLDGPPVVERKFAPGLPPVEVIPQELGRVLLNLLNNAFHAVSQQARQRGDGYVPSVRISTRGEVEHVEIRVEDNGTGIPDSIRERIFEPFFTTKPPGEGVGLGLSLSYGIITQRHAGTLAFETTEGKGTTFIITLPRR